MGFFDAVLGFFKGSSAPIQATEYDKLLAELMALGEKSEHEIRYFFTDEVAKTLCSDEVIEFVVNSTISNDKKADILTQIEVSAFNGELYVVTMPTEDSEESVHLRLLLETDNFDTTHYELKNKVISRRSNG